MMLCELCRGWGFFTTRKFRMLTDYKIEFGEERGCGGRGGGVTNRSRGWRFRAFDDVRTDLLGGWAMRYDAMRDW